MNCLICLSEVKGENLSRKCSCKFFVHKHCFEEFKKKSKFACPVCRRVENDVCLSAMILGIILCSLLFIHFSLFFLVLYKIILDKIN